MNVKTILGLLFGVLLSSNAYAVVIDFTSFLPGDTGTTTLVTPEATFNSFGGNFYVGASGVASEICALSSTNDCAMDFEVIFTSEIENLTLVTSSWQPGDTVEIFAYDIGNSLLGSVTHASNGSVDLTAFFGISRLLFDDLSVAQGFMYADGFAYDYFTFDYAISSPVPAPASIWLFGLGLLMLAGIRKKVVDA